MAAYFSDNIADSSANTTLVTGFKAHVGIKHARTRTTIARCTGLFLTTDTVRMITLKSSDRLIGLELATDGACTAGTVHIGLSHSGANHDGTVQHWQLFANNIAVSTETPSGSMTEIFDEQGTLDGVDRGRTMWEITTLGTGTNYTEDPYLEFDITITPSVSFTDAATELTLVATYTAGD